MPEKRRRIILNGWSTYERIPIPLSIVPSSSITLEKLSFEENVSIHLDLNGEKGIVYSYRDVQGYHFRLTNVTFIEKREEEPEEQAQKEPGAYLKKIANMLNKKGNTQ